MLFSCPECEQQVSDKAHVCPKCGYPIVELFDTPYRWDGSGRFGGYKWIELERRNNRVLVITKDIIELRRFDDECRDWATSELCRYLNGTFLNNFTVLERSGIQQVEQDLVFLLSTKETECYFNNPNVRFCYHRGEAIYWWLRTPSADGLEYVEVVKCDEDGLATWRSSVVSIARGVRPALWLSL